MGKDKSSAASKSSVTREVHKDRSRSRSRSPPPPPLSPNKDERRVRLTPVPVVLPSASFTRRALGESSGASDPPAAAISTPSPSPTFDFQAQMASAVASQMPMIIAQASRMASEMLSAQNAAFQQKMKADQKRVDLKAEKSDMALQASAIKGEGNKAQYLCLMAIKCDNSAAEALLTDLQLELDQDMDSPFYRKLGDVRRLIEASSAKATERMETIKFADDSKFGWHAGNEFEKLKQASSASTAENDKLRKEAEKKCAEERKQPKGSAREKTPFRGQPAKAGYGGYDGFSSYGGYGGPSFGGAYSNEFQFPKGSWALHTGQNFDFGSLKNNFRSLGGKFGGPFLGLIAFC